MHEKKLEVNVIVFLVHHFPIADTHKTIVFEIELNLFEHDLKIGAHDTLLFSTHTGR